MATKEMVLKLRKDYEKGFKSIATNEKGFRQSHYVDWLESIACEHFENNNKKYLCRNPERKIDRWDADKYYTF